MREASEYKFDTIGPMTRIILASQSPRRVDLLTKMGITFETIPSTFEEQLDENRDVEEVAKELALGKALNVAKDHPDAYVIGSDTIVGLVGRQMGKPAHIEDARAMLTALAGQESTVSTGIAIVKDDENLAVKKVDTTHVYFKPESPEVARLREDYLASDDWQDKAGGYGIQSGALPLIDRIVGNYDTIVGLPTELLKEMFAALNVNVDKYL